MGKISGVSTTIIDNVDGFFTSGGGGGGTASLTPTFTYAAGPFGAGTVTVTNSHLYTNPNYFMEVKESGAVIVADADVDHGGLSGAKDHINNAMTFSDNSSASGTRTVEVRAQEFGDYIQSAVASTTYTKGSIQDRYIRFRGVSSTGADNSQNVFISNCRLYTDFGQTGTAYPTTNLTSDTSETGIIISTGHEYSASYDSWKAFDSNTTSSGWWSLGTNTTNNWLQIEFDPATYPTPPELKSALFRFNTSNNASHLKVLSSSTGAFAGEETDHGFFKISENTNMNLG